jgi:hypothetical protein
MSILPTMPTKLWKPEDRESGKGLVAPAWPEKPSPLGVMANQWFQVYGAFQFKLTDEHMRMEET